SRPSLTPPACRRSCSRRRSLGLGNRFRRARTGVGVGVGGSDRWSLSRAPGSAPRRCRRCCDGVVSAGGRLRRLGDGGADVHFRHRRGSRWWRWRRQRWRR
ncbi:unnamed protein product, partial [Ectocarpus sp. 8 AP-2014]